MSLCECGHEQKVHVKKGCTFIKAKTKSGFSILCSCGTFALKGRKVFDDEY